ncbi:MAG: family 10 glycosylhydrolase [Rhodothermaceae bacterium]|nr:family 10 glycosylhydrolase [Rhodothermaceae bacterium]
MDSDILNSKFSIAEAMDYLASRGFNVVYPVVWNKGYTLYPSATMDSLFGLPQDPFFANQNRDPLAELIVEAHRNGMEVIPWFEYGFATSFSQNGGHILSAKPEWAAIDNEGKLVVRNGFDWMNPLHPEVQDFMLSLFREVIETYDVDGVQGDDRLPAMPVEGGYSEVTKALYRDENGRDPTPINIDPTWIQWRSNKLTNFGGKLYRMIKEHAPNLTVSMSPSVWPWSRQNYLQDWPAWVDSGYVDIVHPQVYRWDLTSYQNEIRRLWGSESGTTTGYVDPSQEILISPGLIVKAGSRFNPPGQIADMMRFNRNYDGGGEVFFFYEGLREQNSFLGDSLLAEFYTEPAIMPTRDQLWRPDPLIVLPDDPAISLSGDWQPDTTSAGYRTSPQVAAPGAQSRFELEVLAPFSATYNVFTYIPPEAVGTTADTLYFSYNTPRIVRDGAYSLSRPNSTGWVQLGSVYMDAGDRFDMIYFTSEQSTEPTYIDATMLMVDRAESPDLSIEVSFTSTDQELPFTEEHTLQRNYPNPFSQSTSIPFNLAQPATVSITVYDLLGREIERLVDHVVYEAGDHVVTFDGNLLSPGIYFYRLQTDRFSSAHSMVLIR